MRIRLRRPPRLPGRSSRRLAWSFDEATSELFILELRGQIQQLKITSEPGSRFPPVRTIPDVRLGCSERPSRVGEKRGNRRICHTMDSHLN